MLMSLKLDTDAVDLMHEGESQDKPVRNDPLADVANIQYGQGEGTDVTKDQEE